MTSTTSMTLPEQEDIPSAHQDILAKLRGDRLTEMVRYSWLFPQDAVVELHLEPPLVFRRTVGPLVMSFASGLVASFASLEERASVTLWVEADDQERRDQTAVTTDGPDLYPIDATNPGYSESWLQELIGQRVESIFVLTRDAMGAKDRDLPREVGLLFGFANGQELILSHQLHEGAESFAIIRGEEIQSRWILHGKDISDGRIITDAEIRDGQWQHPRHPYPIEMPPPTIHQLTPKVRQPR